MNEKNHNKKPVSGVLFEPVEFFDKPMTAQTPGHKNFSNNSQCFSETDNNTDEYYSGIIFLMLMNRLKWIKWYSN